jgi:phage tail-like protein
MRRADIEHLLPSIYRLALDPPAEWGLAPDEALGALLDAMETLHQPIEDVLDHLETYLDPRRARATFVPYLAGWLDLDWVLGDPPEDGATRQRPAPRAGVEPIGSGSGRLRELAAAATELARWRGTEHGLRRFLVTATGLPGFVIRDAQVEGDSLPPFHIVVEAPAEAAPLRGLIERIIAEEKPAYVTHELRFGASPA